MLSLIYPDKKLELIPLENPIYQMPFKHPVEFTRSLKNEANEKKPFLLGIKVDKRYVAVYSPYDFSSDLLSSLDSTSRGIKAPSAFKLVTNIISYGLSY